MGKLHRLLNEAFEHNRPSNKVTLVAPFITKTLLFFRDQNPSFNYSHYHVFQGPVIFPTWIYLHSSKY